MGAPRSTGTRTLWRSVGSWWRSVAVGFLAILATLAPWSSTSAAATPPSVRPNFVVIVTDDQRWDTIGRCRNGFDGTDFDAGRDACMPELQRLIMSAGTTFTRAYATTALCCPSRVSLLTGNYARHTGVIDNQGLPLFDDDSTLATWLDAAGYRTALIGKYLNGYGETPGAVPENYVPPGWDSWHAFWGLPDYRSYTLVERDPGETATTLSITGSATSPTACGADATYSTDLLCRRALDFVAGSRDPFFLLFTPFSPHLPTVGPSRHDRSYAQVSLPAYPNHDSIPSPNPPSWLPDQPLTSDRVVQNASEFRSALTANLAVDDAVAALHRQLVADGTLDETVWVFASDNGLARGEHRWHDKGCPYEECHRVPLVVVCPPAVCPQAVGGRVDPEHFALNIDIAPTIAEAAGLEPPSPVDGRSLVPLLGGSAPEWRRRFLLEDQGVRGDLHAPVGVMSREDDGHIYKYVAYIDAAPDVELYDLTEDPWELRNLAGDPAHAAVESSLGASLSEIFPRLTLDGPSGVIAAILGFTWIGSTLYLLLGGADLGCGVWNLFAFRSRRRQQPNLISSATGRTWAANHVWLLFVLSGLFFAFPVAFTELARALYVPFSLALVGIALRGSAFVVGTHRETDSARQRGWTRIAGIASLLTPFFLGATAASPASGRIRVVAGEVHAGLMSSWTSALSLFAGLFAVAICAYLAATSLAVEAMKRDEGAGERDLRIRALVAGATTGLLAALLLVVVRSEAPELWRGMREGGLAAAALSVVGGGASLVLVWIRRYAWARIAAVVTVAAVLLGWGVAQWPYLIVPDVTVADAAAPKGTLRLVAIGLGLSGAVLASSLYLSSRRRGPSGEIGRNAPASTA